MQLGLAHGRLLVMGWACDSIIHVSLFMCCYTSGINLRRNSAQRECRHQQPQVPFIERIESAFLPACSFDIPYYLLAERRSSDCCASVLPCAADFCHHSAALAVSLGTPSPLAYISAILYWAKSLPCSAAFSYHSAAFAAFLATPSPV